jgi:hypothetical protein
VWAVVANGYVVMNPTVHRCLPKPRKLKF